MGGMRKMQLRLDQDQVELICDALLSSDLVSEQSQGAQRAMDMVVWLKWRAAKLWGAPSAGQRAKKQSA